MKQISINILQTTIYPDVSKNIENVQNLVKKSATNSPHIICLPELFLYPYFPQYKKNKQTLKPTSKKIIDHLQTCAKKHNVTIIAGTIIEKSNNKHYNTSLTINNKGIITNKYRKVHLPNDPHFYEQHYFTPANKYTTFNINNTKAATLICYDQWFPEPPRILTLKGAKIIFYPSAIGFTKYMKQHEPFSQKRWIQAHAAHASLNGIYTVAINRVGKDDNINFWGASHVCDPFGNIVAQASSTKQEILTVNIDLSLVEKSQQGWEFLQNRQPKTYKTLSK